MSYFSVSTFWSRNTECQENVTLSIFGTALKREQRYLCKILSLRFLDFVMNNFLDNESHNKSRKNLFPAIFNSFRGKPSNCYIVSEIGNDV